MKTLVNFQSKNLLVASMCFSIILEAAIFGALGTTYLVSRDKYTDGTTDANLNIDLVYIGLMFAMIIVFAVLGLYFAVLSQTAVFTGLKSKIKLARFLTDFLIALGIVMFILSLAYSVMMATYYSTYSIAGDRAVSGGWFRAAAEVATPLVGLTCLGLSVIAAFNRPLLKRIAALPFFAERSLTTSKDEQNFGFMRNMTRLVYGILDTDEMERGRIKDLFESTVTDMMEKVNPKDKSLTRVQRFFAYTHTKTFQFAMGVLGLIFAAAVVFLSYLAFLDADTFAGGGLNFNTKFIMATLALFFAIMLALVAKFVFEYIIDLFRYASVASGVAPLVAREVVASYGMESRVRFVGVKKAGELAQVDEAFLVADASEVSALGKWVAVFAYEQGQSPNKATGYMLYPIKDKTSKVIFMNAGKTERKYEAATEVNLEDFKDEHKFAKTWFQTMMASLMNYGKISEINAQGEMHKNVVPLGMGKPKTGFDALLSILSLLVLGYLQTGVVNEN